MKKNFLLLALPFLACQPRIESRERMDLVANRMSDSILKLIDSSLAEPGKILAGKESPIASSASSFTPVSLPK